MAGNDLFIKFATTDTFARPINPCGPPNIVWDSQSIWLSKPGAPTQTLTKATENQQIQVNVVVTNHGGAPFTPDPVNGIFVSVQVWICNYAIAVGPNGGIASAGGSAGQEGTITNTIASSNGTGVTSVLWTPASGDLNINTTAAGEGHVCVAANVYWEGTAPPKESHTYPPPGVLQICGDGPNPQELLGGHHGQKNILIAKGESVETMAIPMNVFNLEEHEDEFLIEAVEVTGALRQAEREVMLAERWVTLDGGKPHVKPRTVHGQPIEPIERAQLRAGGRLVLTKGKKPIRAARRPVKDFGFGGHDGRKIVLRVRPKKPEMLKLEWDPPKETPGTVHVFDILQRTERGRLIGGARIAAVTT